MRTAPTIRVLGLLVILLFGRERLASSPSQSNAARSIAEPAAREIRSNFATAPNLQLVTHHAGTIVLGVVISAEPVRAEPGAVKSVRVRLRVQDAIRGGARAGRVFTFCEWAGLWADDPHRYTAGQRLLLFLYPPSSLGLTSPVAGRAGRISVTPDGQVVAELGPSGPGASAEMNGPAADGSVHGTIPYKEFAQKVREISQAQP